MHKRPNSTVVYLNIKNYESFSDDNMDFDLNKERDGKIIYLFASATILLAKVQF